MKLEYKENEIYKELELYHDNIKIGDAEINLCDKMLTRITIYEPYQNKGYGTEIIKMLCRDYGCNCLWVRTDNFKAIHVYEKCGFKKVEPTMYLMKT